MPERRTVSRKKFSYYMRVMDDDTAQTLGHMVDISEHGLQLETPQPLPPNKDFYVRIELTPDLANQLYLVFLARTKWCRMDDIQPNLYRCGFAIVEIMPEDREIVARIIEKYGSA